MIFKEDNSQRIWIFSGDKDNNSEDNRQKIAENSAME